MGAQALAFSVPNADAELLLRLVASYGGCPSPLDIKVVEGLTTVEFPGENGEALQGLTTACTCVAKACPSAAQLLGSTPEEEAKVLEWLTFAVTELSPLLDDKLVRVNAWLASRTFLAGAAPSLADLVVYAAAAPAAAALPVAQHGHFLNLLRWYDHVHAVADAGALFPAAKFDKPAFVAPPPPPAPAAKDKAAAGGAKGEDAKKKGGDDKKAAAAAAPAAAAAAAAAPAPDGKKKEKKEKKAKGGDAPATPAVSSGDAPAAPAGPTVDALDIRVGVITKVGPHPNADSLYLEEIDLGEGEPRQVVSGLRKFVPEEAMAGRRVVVVCNLKPAKMREVMSYGMVLCASNAEHTAVDPIVPPEGAAVGERVAFEGYGAEPEAVINPKKKIFEKIAPDLVVDAGGVCTYRGVPFMTKAGPVTATMPGAHIA